MQAFIDSMPVFFLIFTRITGMMMTAPVIGSRNIAGRVRAGFAFAIAFVIAPFVLVSPDVYGMALLPYAGFALKELMVGVALGFFAMLVFNAVQMAGQILDVQVGFGIANVVDPLTSAQVPVMGQFQFILAILLFLAVNGHHLLILALKNSFDLVPVGMFGFTPTLAEKVTQMGSEFFELAVSIGAPAVGALFLAEMALGMVARTVPQMNVFIVGIPMKIALGFVIVLAIMPVFASLMVRAFQGIYWDLMELSRAMGTPA